MVAFKLMFIVALFGMAAAGVIPGDKPLVNVDASVTNCDPAKGVVDVKLCGNANKVIPRDIIPTDLIFAQITPFNCDPNRGVINIKLCGGLQKPQLPIEY